VESCSTRQSIPIERVERAFDALPQADASWSHPALIGPTDDCGAAGCSDCPRPARRAARALSFSRPTLAALSCPVAADNLTLAPVAYRPQRERDELPRQALPLIIAAAVCSTVVQRPVRYSSYPVGRFHLQPRSSMRPMKARSGIVGFSSISREGLHP
jgi:hypothetical protein